MSDALMCFSSRAVCFRHGKPAKAGRWAVVHVDRFFIVLSVVHAVVDDFGNLIPVGWGLRDRI